MIVIPGATGQLGMAVVKQLAKRVAAERIGVSDLGRRDVQIVVDAAVMGEDSGAPRVIAVHSW